MDFNKTIAFPAHKEALYLIVSVIATQISIGKNKKIVVQFVILNVIRAIIKRIIVLRVKKVNIDFLRKINVSV